MDSVPVLSVEYLALFLPPPRVFKLLTVVTHIHCPAFQLTEWVGRYASHLLPPCCLDPKELFEQQINSKIASRPHTDAKCPSLFCCAVGISTHWCLWAFQWASCPITASLEHSDWAGGRVSPGMCLAHYSVNHEPAWLLLHEVILNFHTILNVWIYFFLVIFPHTFEWIIPHIIRVHNSKAL